MLIGVIKIGQSEVYQFLKNNPSWHTAKHIADKLIIDQQKVTTAGKKLARFNFIERRLMEDKISYEYKIK